MADDLVSLFRDSADESPPLSPEVVDKAIARGHTLERQRRWLVVGTAAAAAVAAITIGTAMLTGGDQDAGPDPSGTPDNLPVVTDQGEVLVSCGGASPGWRPSIMADGIPGLLSEDEAQRAFQRILEDPRYGGEASLSLFPDGTDVEWRVLFGDESRLTLGLGEWTVAGPGSERSMLLSLERESDRWVGDGWGGCRHLSPVLKPGNSWAELTEYVSPGPSDTTVAVFVHEVQCASGRDPSPYLDEPVIVETDDAVTVYWTSEPTGGDCQGTPSVRRTIELSKPLGARPLLDGYRYPASPVPVQITESTGEAFELYTHCGITHLSYNRQIFTRVGGPLTDAGGGNPPPGWGNPLQKGWITVTGDVAVFTDALGHREEFELNPGDELGNYPCD